MMTDSATTNAQIPNSNSRSMALLAHLSAFGAFVVGFGFIGPLIIWLLKRDSDSYVAQESLEALNFNISVLIYGTVAGAIASVSIFGIFAFFLFVGLAIAAGIALIVGGIAWFVLVIVAAVRANQGTGFRYPLNLRLIK